MNPKLTTVALMSLAIGALIASVMVGRRADVTGQNGGTVTGKALIGGPFSLVDTNGKRVSDTDFRGRYMLVFFGYTYCPDICPAGLQVITAALDQLGAVGEHITPVFVTIDPTRDTPEKLSAYLKSFHPRFVGLTGSPEEIAAAVKAYRVYAKKVPDERNPADYTMDHTSIVYLMNPAGNMVAFAPDATKADALAAQLRKGLAVK
jgi:protein SCO1